MRVMPRPCLVACDAETLSDRLCVTVRVTACDCRLLHMHVDTGKESIKGAPLHEMCSLEWQYQFMSDLS